MTDLNTTYCSTYIPETAEGSVIWHGDEKTPVNILYIYRTQLLRISFYEMAFHLEISPEKLGEYENGRCHIYHKDAVRIMESLKISLSELYPQMCSYD